MKAILVIDAPNNCSECPCCHENECGNQYKGYVGDYIGWNSGRPSWCQLRLLPIKNKYKHDSMMTIDHENDITLADYQNFCWNACFESVIGDNKDEV